MRICEAHPNELNDRYLSPNLLWNLHSSWSHADLLMVCQVQTPPKRKASPLHQSGALQELLLNKSAQITQTPQTNATSSPRTVGSAGHVQAQTWVHFFKLNEKKTKKQKQKEMYINLSSPCICCICHQLHYGDSQSEQVHGLVWAHKNLRCPTAPLFTRRDKPHKCQKVWAMSGRSQHAARSQNTYD